MTPIYQGDSKTALITLAIDGVSDLSGWTVKALLLKQTTSTAAATASLAIACSYVSGMQVKMQLTKTQSKALAAGAYKILIRAESEDDGICGTVEPSGSELTILPDPEAA